MLFFFLIFPFFFFWFTAVAQTGNYENFKIPSPLITIVLLFFQPAAIIFIKDYQKIFEPILS